jgi:hypothetical protein
MTWLIKIEMESKEDLEKFVEILPLSFPGLIDIEYEELED